MNGAVRVFAAIPISPELRQRLADLQQRLQKIIQDRAVRWTRPDQIHLTLKFFGDIALESLPELENGLRRAAKVATPFSLRTESIGCFPDARRPSVIWAGVNGETNSLSKLHAAVARETIGFGGPADSHPYVPHLTLARIKASGDRLAGQIASAMQSVTAETFGGWQVGHVELIRSELSSQGAQYTTLKQIPI